MGTTQAARKREAREAKSREQRPVARTEKAMTAESMHANACKTKARKQMKYAMGRRQSHSRPCTQVAAAREGQRGRTGGSKQAHNKHAHKAKARKQKKICHGQAEKPLRAPEGKAGGLN